MSVNELAALSCTHQSSVSAVVSKLVDAGLVHRSQSPIDGRRVELTLTGAGRSLLESEIVTPQERMIASLGRFEPSRLHDLRLLLEELILESGFEVGSAPMFFHGTERVRKSGSK
jgi:DNA-binding MarR family transcriptional regulator